MLIHVTVEVADKTSNVPGTPIRGVFLDGLLDLRRPATYKEILRNARTLYGSSFQKELHSDYRDVVARSTRIYSTVDPSAVKRGGFGKGRTLGQESLEIRSNSKNRAIVITITIREVSIRRIAKDTPVQ